MPTYNSKIVFGSETLMDITDTTALASDVLSGKKFYGKDGAPTNGTCTFDSDTTDANALATEILTGKIAYVNKNKITGSMANNGAVAGTIATKAQTYTVPAGYHDGSGLVQISATEQLKIIPGNIKSGVIILGETGTYTGEGVTAQAKTFTPKKGTSTGTTVIVPDTDYDYLSQVTVNDVYYTQSLNAQGGYTLTIVVAS